MTLLRLGSASAVEEDPVYREEVFAKVKTAITSISTAASDGAKIDEMKKLKAEIESERDRVRKELEGASASKSAKEKIARRSDRLPASLMTPGKSVTAVCPQDAPRHSDASRHK
ncbi:MAG: hypothetical protein AAB250_12150, partial [Bdellovibrionota bacterium]